MGCGSSKEAHADPQDASSQAVPSIRATNITSQTAINTPLSTTPSRHQSSYRPYAAASASNISTPRTSITGRHRQHQELNLTEHYNVPLTAPKPWTSTDRTWTGAQLQRERKDYFETRVTGTAEIWAALKEVAALIRQGDLVDAQGILSAADITLPTGRLEDGAYDQRGVLYRLPEHIVTNPLNLTDDDGVTVIGDEPIHKELEGNDRAISAQATNDMSQEKLDKGKDAIEKDAIKVRCRLSDRGGPDIVVLVGRTQPVSILLRRLRSEATIASSSRVKVVYFGKILDESKTLEDQGWQQGHVVQALVSNFAP